MTIANQIISFKLSGISYSGTSTQLNSTAGVTAGTCTASKALVVDSFRNINNINTITATTLTATTLNGTLATSAQPNITSIGILNNLTVSNNLTLSQHNGSTTGLILGSTLVTATGVQLNYNNITAPGTAQASKALILDSSSNITGINSLTVTSLELTNLTFNGTLLTVNGTQLNYNNITTPGVAQASRSLVLNSSSNISGINSLSATTLTATTLNGTLASGPQTGITGVGTLTSLTLNGPITGVTTLATSGNITCGGNLSATNLTGTIVTSSQPNITGVGTLSTLSVTGQITSGTISATNISVGGVDITSSLSNLGPISNVTAGTASASKALILDASRNITNINSLTATSLVATGTITGSLATASQPGITSLGTLTSLALSGSITGATGITMNGGSLAGANSISATSLNGRIDTASQPNITSLGSLSSLTVTGSIGIGTTIPSRQLEINSADGSCLRLSHSAPTGSATNCTDFTVSNSGALNINSSNNLINLQSNVVIGRNDTENNDTENILYFNGVNGDAGNNMTVIAERLYSGSDKSELLLFKGHDLSGSFGPDRIRARAGEIRFQIINSGEEYSSTIADNNNALIIESSGKIGVNCTSITQQLEINNATGNCLRLIYNDTNGTPTVFSDININSSGNLNIKSSNNTVQIGDSTTDIAQTLLIGSSSSSASTGVLRILTSSSGNYIQSGLSATGGSAADLIFTNFSQTITGSSRKIIFKSDGKVGFGTSNPFRQLEINDPDGNCLRLSNNAPPSGNATNYLDQSVSNVGISTFITEGASPGFVFTGSSTKPITDHPYISISNTTASTSSSTGALRVAGGAYFGANSLIAANLTLSGTSSTLSLSGASSVISISNPTASTSISSGALRVAGGAYFGADSIFAANLSLSGSLTLSGGTSSNLNVSGNVNIVGTVSMSNNLTLQGTSNSLNLSGSSAFISITNNTASTSISSGALRVAGGAYFGANSLFNANLTLQGASSTLSLSGAFSVISISNTTASTSSTTGALRVAGGAYFGANSIFNSTLRVMGQSSPITGAGIEIGYVSASNIANIYSFDRTGGTYKNINLNDKMYIKSDGNVGIGTVSPVYGLDVSSTIRATNYMYVSDNGAFGRYIGCWAANNNWAIGSHDSSTGTTYKLRIGVSNGTGDWRGEYPDIFSGAYNNVSDYRIKENITNLNYGLNEIKKIRPVLYNIKNDLNNKQIGFLAHEMQEIIPEIVSGDKDAVDENGKEVHQGINYANLTSVIIKGMQEHIDITDNLEEQIKLLIIENIQLKQQMTEIQKTLELLLQKN